MEFFRRKDDGAREGRRTGTATGGDGDARANVSHRVTKELARAESLAHMLAMSRAAATVEPADFLAGLYIYDWERLSKYWEDRAAIESYLQKICRISPQRWHHWIEFYDRERRGEEKREARKIFGAPRNAVDNGAPLAPSGELVAILRKAETIAPHRDTFEGREIPILTSECVLLAMTKTEGLEIGRRLLESGLDVDLLEQEARNPRHAPLHGAEDK
ncbi:MAG TPA: hypothetical protein VEU52_11590 [Candidatus Limnocylindrales bacterium]|nr:hypothetical protein [Candidatus Limnocylindrales bacterium]